MAILDEDGLLIGNSGWFSDKVINKIRNSNNQITDAGNRRYLFRNFNPWNWTIVMSINKSFFPEELISIQKYALLLTIIFLVLSMQSIIFIAHHISKPIKYFAEVCKKIELGNMKEKVNINRGDEIGVLANSFNHMIDQIDTSTEKLIEMTKFNEDILKNIDIGIMTTDNNGSLLTMNKSGVEILTRYVDDPIMEELEKQTIQTIKEKINLNEVISMNSLNGKVIYIDVGTSLLIKEDGSFYGAICSFNDITERKVLENNLVRVDRLASVGQFAAGLAHEIRNPLTGIKTGIQVIKNRELNKNELANVELMDGLTYEIDRINNLVTDLLDFSKPKQAMREKENICDVIRKSLDLAKEGIVRKEISVAITGKDCPKYVFADKGQAEQIFLNIITNAVEAMDNHGNLLISADTVSEDGINWIRITFEDDGIGIEEEQLDKIFNPFFTTKVKGTGLGLVVVFKLIEENNGKISIESKINQGTKITILLPEYWRDKCED
jgi:PAS domain S-box